jgi:hypothetical protein
MSQVKRGQLEHPRPSEAVMRNTASSFHALANSSDSLAIFAAIRRDLL